MAAWLLPGELLEVDHGMAVRTYLTEMVTLLRLHPFEPGDLQFEGASVSSFVAWFRNHPPSPDHVVDMTAGGTIAAPNRTGTLDENSMLLRGVGSGPRLGEAPLGSRTQAPPSTTCSDLAPNNRSRCCVSIGAPWGQ